MKRTFILLLLFFSTRGFTQNLEKIGDKDMLKVSGGFNFNSAFYQANGIAPRRDPFAWFFSGSLNFTLLDWSIPFSYSYSNLHGTFSQPFNQYSVSPQYKWIKTHIGYTSMSFSSYTLAGHTFLGGGAELTPGNWTFDLMCGRLRKAVEYDILNGSDAGMSFRRFGYGAKAGYEKNGHGLALIFFHAYDDPKSIPFVPAASLLRPMENTVVSLTGKTRLWTHFFTEIEYALSGLTRNVNSPGETDSTIRNPLPVVFHVRSTSQFFHAGKASFGYQGQRFRLNLNYERVDPDYQTLGAYYFTNDVENITLAPALSFFKNKLNLSLNTGMQRNNLDQHKLGTMKRWAGSVALSFVPGPAFSANGSYSNFTSYTRMRPQNDPYFQSTLDTLNFYQLAQNASLTLNCNFGKKKLKQSTVLTGSYQVTGEKNGEAVSVISLYGSESAVKIPSVVYNANLAYTANWTPTRTSGTFSVNMNESLLGGISTVYLGPSLGLAQSFMRNTIRASLGTTYNRVITGGVTSSAVMNQRLGLNYSPKMKTAKFGKPTFGISAAYLSKFGSSAYSELTVMANVSYGF
jgi:hypothetical protein